MPKSESRKQKKNQHPIDSLSAAAVLLLWGLLLLYAPSYLEITSDWRWLLVIIGAIPLILSFILAIVAIGNLWEKESLASSMIFLIPAMAIHLTVTRAALASTWVTIGKVIVLIFVSLGGLLFFHGLSQLFLKSIEQQNDQNIELSPEELAEKKLARRKTDVKTIWSVIIALSSLALGIIKLILEFGK